MTDGLKAGIYARKSTKDDEEDQRLSRSVEDQLKDCRKLVADRGWVEAATYPEDATSAFKKKVVTLPDGRRVRRNVRPLWTQMIEDLWEGRIDVLVAYDLDRAMREPRDLEDLIEVVEQTNRKTIAVTGNLDLSTDSGIMMARVLAASANKSSRDTSRRVSRAAMRRAEAGEFHGSIAMFGYELVKDPAGRVQGLAINPEEAVLVREAADRLLAGESMYGVVTDWIARGLTTRQGKIWRSRAIKRIVTAPSVSGHREYDGHPIKAKWDGILTEETRQRLLALLSDTSHAPSNFESGTRRKYGLSGLVVCGTCGRTLVSMTPKNASPAFRCNKATGGCGRMRISMGMLEPYVVGRIKAHLSSKAFQRMYDRAQVDTTESDARLDLARFQRRLDALTQEKDDELIADAEYRKRRARIEEQMRSAEAAVAKVSRDVVLSNLPGPDEFVRLWQEKDAVWRRTMAAAVIKEIRVYTWSNSMTSTVTPRRNESEEAFAIRRGKHNAKVMADRVVIVGVDGKDWPKR